MSLVHDMAESLVGDIVPSDNISKEEKHGKEKVSLIDILCDFGRQINMINAAGCDSEFSCGIILY